MNRPGDLENHTLAVLVENKAGVLARVADLFARRGYNIVSLAVAPTDDERFSRITIVVEVEKAPLDQIVKQLFKLVNVVEIAEMIPEASVTRELMVVNVEVPEERRQEFFDLVERRHGRILHDAHGHVIISLAGEPDEIDAMETELRVFEIFDLQRTGRVALRIVESDVPLTRV
jgi:acetolactate synthase-1/3 small subunit